MAQIFFICSILCMAGREAKLRKLDDFGRKVPTASQSALSKILKEMKGMARLSSTKQNTCAKLESLCLERKYHHLEK
jgi:hypothetical protein